MSLMVLMMRMERKKKRKQKQKNDKFYILRMYSLAFLNVKWNYYGFTGYFLESYRYHSWEHYSSVRNIDGPYSGPPEIKVK